MPTTHDSMRKPRNEKRKVQIARERLGLSQRQLALKAGISPQVITYLERPKTWRYTPSTKVWEKLAEALETTREFITRDQPVVEVCECCGGKGTRIMLDGVEVNRFNGSTGGGEQ